MSEAEDLKKVANLAIASIVLVLIFSVIWFCYGTISYIIPSAIREDFIIIFYDFNAKIGFFDKEIYTKIFCALLFFTWALLKKTSPLLEFNKTKEMIKLIIGASIFFLNGMLLPFAVGAMTHVVNITYIITLIIALILLISAIAKLHSAFFFKKNDDLFNSENETFPQEQRLMETPYSVNIRTKFQWENKMQNGWINVINPFRATAVLGTPGSGKSFAIINQYIRQHTAKGFSMFVYDFKFPALTEIAYANFLQHKNKYPDHKFFILNFDDLESSARCNPIEPSLMTDIADAYQASYTIMLNLNKTWIKKQGDFFVESPIILFAAIIWYLKLYQNGKYCTIAHAIELINCPYTDLFPLLNSQDELKNYLSPFMDAWEGDAQDQLQGQIASAKIPLARVSSPQLYWVLTGSDFTLDINNPQRPITLCVGNNSERKDIYGAILGLYNAKVVNLINKPKRVPCSLIVDELPTIYFKGLDDLIATARSNKVSVLLGFQDMSQLIRDYGKEEATVIQQTIGNYFSGQVSGDTAKYLSTRFGKKLQKKDSFTTAESGVSASVSYQQDIMIPESVIASLSQGQFVGNIVDDFGMEIPQKVFRCNIQVNMQEVNRENEIIEKFKIPKFYSFKKVTIDEEGKKIEVDMKKEIIQANYSKIKKDIAIILKTELAIIKAEQLKNENLDE